jgi:hypothetical protein
LQGLQLIHTMNEVPSASNGLGGGES